VHGCRVLAPHRAPRRLQQYLHESRARPRHARRLCGVSGGGGARAVAAAGGQLLTAVHPPRPRAGHVQQLLPLDHGGRFGAGCCVQAHRRYLKLSKGAARAPGSGGGTAACDSRAGVNCWSCRGRGWELPGYHHGRWRSGCLWEAAVRSTQCPALWGGWVCWGHMLGGAGGRWHQNAQHGRGSVWRRNTAAAAMAAQCYSGAQ
jgi:hypothetical protein